MLGVRIGLLRTELGLGFRVRLWGQVRGRCRAEGNVVHSPVDKISLRRISEWRLAIDAELERQLWRLCANDRRPAVARALFDVETLTRSTSLTPSTATDQLPHLMDGATPPPLG